MLDVEKVGQIAESILEDAPFGCEPTAIGLSWWKVSTDWMPGRPLREKTIEGYLVQALAGC
jgi:hypothetical protein